ncbi:MAG: TraB/GumN family protein [Saprospiraceae bacterium]|nr:TraB/GumN family protein [Saprospiraceae bacterium]
MAKLLRFCCLIAAFCLATTKLSSQIAKPEYALLWEISGNDLPKSCYLFGTMHLRDERVFELCDSALLAIESVEAFAMEVHPDSALNYVINLTLNDRDTFNELRETLSEEAYEEVEDLLRRKTNTSMDELKSKNPKLVEQMLKGIKEMPFSKKRPQILDLTLFAYASDKGKNMFGLERMSEYSDLTKAFFEIFEDTTVSNPKPPVSLNDLIETYRKGDLDAIRGMVNERFPNENYRQELLTNRNVRMVEKMIGLGKQQSIFCAVGTAHLPGEDGMLALLRNKGYKVRKVQASFTGVADSLFEANKPIPKQLTFMDEERGFSAHLPAEPQVHWARQQLDEGNTMTTKLYIAMDLRSGREYTIAVFDYPPSLVFTDKQAVFKTAIENYEQQWGPQIGESRTVYVDGFLGSASKYRTQGSYINVQGTMRGTRFYTFATTHPVGTSDSSSQAFFKSVRLLPLKQSPMRPIELPEIGCTLALPSGYHLNVDTSVAETTFSYSSGDTLASNNYILVETIFSKYFETEAPDSFLINYRQNLAEDSTYTVKDTLFGSMPGFYLTANDTANLNFTEHLVVLTDTGTYELIVNKAAPDTGELAWAFFNSFKPKRQWTGALLKRETSQLLLGDLASEDTLIAQQAKDVLYEHEFQDEDLTAIFNALRKPMPWDTMPWGSTHGMLTSNLEDRKDERLLPFLVAYFHDNKAMRYRQRNALQVMLSMQDSAAYNAYFELAPTVDTAGGLDIPFYGHLNFLIQDSALVLELLPRLFPLRKHPAYNYMVYNAISNSINAKWDDRSGFHPTQPTS